MIITYKYKLYNNEYKELNRYLWIASKIYNRSVALSKRYYRLYKKTLNFNNLQKYITKLKHRPKYQYWNELNSQTIQDIVQRIDKGYKQFFRNIKQKKRCSVPDFKSYRKYKSITLKQTGYKLLENNKINIFGKTYKYFKSRDIGGKIKRLTIKRDKVGDYYLVFSVEEFVRKIKSMTGKIAGFDFGLKTYLQCSDGNKYESSYPFLSNLKLVKKYHKQLSKKKKGSKNRKKARLKLARLYRKISNQRLDFHFKLANYLLSIYDVLIFEDLNLEWMKLKYGKKISDLGFGDFLNILKYLSDVSNKKVLFVDKFFPSSQLCSVCGYQNKELKLKDRKWICNQCHTEHDRDYNASINIEREGASSLSLNNVSLSSLKAIVA